MINSVRGPIQPSDLGKTMMHEHLLWDQRNAWWPGDPDDQSLKAFFHEPVRMENLGRIRFHLHQVLDNISQDDVGLAIDEIRPFKEAGGSTIVDVTSEGLSRNPQALRLISEISGINIIMGSGYYISRTHPAEIVAAGCDEIARRIIEEFRTGVGNTGIKPGVIGEIGISSLDDENERKVLKAAASASLETGAALYIHPPIFEKQAHDLLDIVESAGADLHKVVYCHCDPTLDDPAYHESICKRGANIEFDQFGIECYTSDGHFLPRDIDRIKAVKILADRGYVSNLVISQDVCFKICLIKYGGWGYGHILRDLVPFMLMEGISAEDLQAMLVDNPRRILSLGD